MRAGLAVGSLVLLLLAAGAAPAGTPDPHIAVLKVAQVDLRAALTDEQQAEAALKAGDRARADADIRRAKRPLDIVLNAAGRLTPPPELAKADPTDPWNAFTKILLDIVARDGTIAFDLGPRYGAPTAVVEEKIAAANERKGRLLALIRNELAHPDCAEVVDLRGPIVVNGIAQGRPVLTVDLTCKKPIDSIYVDIEGAIPTSIDAGGDPTALKAGGKVLEVDAKGSKSIEVSMQTQPDPAAGGKVDIVEIAGDSSTEYLQEVM